MPSWLVKLNTNIFPSDGDIYVCTQSAWPSISKFIVFLLEECWGSNSHLDESSGLLKGYVCIEGSRYVWFGHNHSAGPSDVTLMQFSEGCAHSSKDILIWCYLPRVYRQFIQLYIDLKHVLVGRVPFKAITEDELLTQVVCNERADSDLYLLTKDSEDLLFYCIQSLHFSLDSVVPTTGWSGVKNSMIVQFPHHPFTCVSVHEMCNIPADRVPLLSRAMIDGLVTNNSDEGSVDVNETVDVSQVNVAFMLESVKDEVKEECELPVNQKTQEILDEQQLEIPQESNQHKNKPSVHKRTRKGPHSKGEKTMSYRKLLSISKSYGQLAAAKQSADRKLWRGLSSQVSPTLLLKCPKCCKFFSPPSPKSPCNLLMHMRSKHKKYNTKLLSSISNELDILVPFMQKKIAVWNKEKVNSL